jgi:hypothetical protein
MRIAAIVFSVLAACAGTAPSVRLDEVWPAQTPGYDDTTTAWTRATALRGQYQEALNLHAVFKSPDWRAAHAERVADQRGLAGPARDQLITQAKADMAGPYELELLVITWDRRENDLDRGKKSVWHVVLVDEQGHEIEPLEIVRDRRPIETLRAEFLEVSEFATAYVARFPRTTPLLGPSVRTLRLRMSGERGAVELLWAP